MVQDDRLGSGAKPAGWRSADDIVSAADRPSGLPRRAAKTAEREARGTTTLLSERNGQTALIPTEAVRIAHDICHALQRDPDGARAAAARLVTLLTPSPAVEPAGSRGGLAPWQKRKVDQYLRENLHRAMQVKDLASQISVSVGHFYRAFRETHGVSPQRYITRLRLGLAQDLMLNSDSPLAQIALTCGFADQSHLSRAFRRVLAATPSAWRRRNRDDARADAKAQWPSPPGLR